MKLGIGTTQFGLDYGITNKQGQTQVEEVSKIFKTAELNCIEVIDTAHLYGNSEAIIGSVLSKDNKFKIITKTITFNKEEITLEDVNLFEKTFISSLEKLQTNSIYGLMLHRQQDLFSQNGDLLFKKLIELKNCNKVNKIGVSVYNSEEITQIINNFDIDIIQIPFNIFDQRLKNDETLKKLKSKNIEVHARSIFLQGVILMQSELVNKTFNDSQFDLHFSKFQAFLQDKNINAQDLAINFVKNIEEIDHFVLGLNNEEQLSSNINSYNQNIDIDLDELKIFHYNDINIIDPRKWTSKK
ncbi:MAG: aldo/keto reductase [bacterium]